MENRVFETKARTLIDLICYLVSCVLLFVSLFASVWGLLICTERATSNVAFIIAASLILIGTILAVASGLLTFIPKGEDTDPRPTIRASNILSIIVSGIVCAASISLLFGRWLTPTGSTALDSFILGYGLTSLVLAFLILIFDLWHMAWIKENPHLYTNAPLEEDAIPKKDFSPAKRKTSTKKTPKKSVPKIENKKNNIIEVDSKEK